MAEDAHAHPLLDELKLVAETDHIPEAQAEVEAEAGLEAIPGTEAGLAASLGPTHLLAVDSAEAGVRLHARDPPLDLVRPLLVAVATELAQHQSQAEADPAMHPALRLLDVSLLLAAEGALPL